MREIVPELLDGLAPDDPAALQSRDEMRVMNLIMGNHRWVCRILEEQELGCHRILELGAGDGALARRAWGEGLVPLAQWSALDVVPAPLGWPSEAIWRQRELFAQPVLPDAEIIVANLFLHQFPDEQLRVLGARLPGSCRLLIACEPARRWIHSLQARFMSAFLELGHVTHHDMLVSIRAGFAGDELKQAMGLSGWRTATWVTWRGAYRFIASR